MIETKLIYISNKKNTRPFWKVQYWDHNILSSNPFDKNVYTRFGYGHYYGTKKFIRKDVAEKFITLLLLKG